MIYSSYNNYDPEYGDHMSRGAHLMNDPWTISTEYSTCEWTDGPRLANNLGICPLCFYNIAKDELPVIFIRDHDRT